MSKDPLKNQKENHKCHSGKLQHPSSRKKKKGKEAILAKSNRCFNGCGLRTKNHVSFILMFTGCIRSCKVRTVRAFIIPVQSNLIFFADCSKDALPFLSWNAQTEARFLVLQTMRRLTYATRPK